MTKNLFSETWNDIKQKESRFLLKAKPLACLSRFLPRSKDQTLSITAKGIALISGPKQIDLDYDKVDSICWKSPFNNIIVIRSGDRSIKLRQTQLCNETLRILILALYNSVPASRHRHWKSFWARNWRIFDQREPTHEIIEQMRRTKQYVWCYWGIFWISIIATLIIGRYMGLLLPVSWVLPRVSVTFILSIALVIISTRTQKQPTQFEVEYFPQPNRIVFLKCFGILLLPPFLVFIFGISLKMESQSLTISMMLEKFSQKNIGIVLALIILSLLTIYLLIANRFGSTGKPKSDGLTIEDLAIKKFLEN